VLFVTVYAPVYGIPAAFYAADKLKACDLHDSIRHAYGTFLFPERTADSNTVPVAISRTLM